MALPNAEPGGTSTHVGPFASIEAEATCGAPHVPFWKSEIHRVQLPPVGASHAQAEQSGSGPG